MRDSWSVGRKEQVWAVEHRKVLGNVLLHELPNQTLPESHLQKSQMEQTYMGKLQGELEQAVAPSKGIQVEFFFLINVMPNETDL